MLALHYDGGGKMGTLKLWQAAVRVLVVGCATLAVVPTQAQDAWPYHPVRPTMSPNMEYLRKSTGPMGTYLSDVRPAIQLNDVLARQQSMIRRDQTAISTIEQSVPVSSFAPQQIPRTGSGGAFMDYSHFYPRVAAPTRR
jgi:hypothetical protein